MKTGEWIADEMNGKGVYEFSNGDKYDGHFLNDKKSGNGIYYYSNGSRYEGIIFSYIKSIIMLLSSKIIIGLF